MGLTPDTPGDLSLAALRDETGQTFKPDCVQTLACIGHDPRLSQLLEALTGQVHPAFGHGELVVVEGNSWNYLQAGNGRLASRLAATESR